MRVIISIAVSSLVDATATTTTTTSVCSFELDGRNKAIIDAFRDTEEKFWNSSPFTSTIEHETLCILARSFSERTIASETDVLAGIDALSSNYGRINPQFAEKFKQKCGFDFVPDTLTGTQTIPRLPQYSMDDILTYGDPFYIGLFCQFMYFKLYLDPSQVSGSEWDVSNNLLIKFIRNIGIGEVDFGEAAMSAKIDPALRIPRTFARCGGTSPKIFEILERSSDRDVLEIEKLASLLSDSAIGIKRFCSIINESENLQTAVTSIISSHLMVGSRLQLVECYKHDFRYRESSLLRDLFQKILSLPLSEGATHHFCLSLPYSVHDSAIRSIRIIEQILDERYQLILSSAPFYIRESQERILQVIPSISIIPVIAVTFRSAAKIGLMVAPELPSLCDVGPFDIARRSLAGRAWSSLHELANLSYLSEDENLKICSLAARFDAGIKEKLDVSKTLLFQSVLAETSSLQYLHRTMAIRILCNLSLTRPEVGLNLDRIEEIINNQGKRACGPISQWNNGEITFADLVGQFPDYKRGIVKDAYRVPRTTTVRELCKEPITRDSTIAFLDQIEVMAKKFGSKICKPVVEWNRKPTITDDQLFTSIASLTTPSLSKPPTGGWIRRTLNSIIRRI